MVDPNETEAEMPDLDDDMEDDFDPDLEGDEDGDDEPETPRSDLT